MATLRGEAVDRPAVSFYELNGLDENPANDNPFNIFSHPSWQPLIDLTREKTDRIVMRWVPFLNAPVDPMAEMSKTETEIRDGNRYNTFTIDAGFHKFTSRSMQEPDVNTVWTLEHLLKDEDDLKAYLNLPMPQFGGIPNVETVLSTEEKLGDTGIVMIDTPDPLCIAASMFEMGEYTVLAMTEPELFRKLLDRFAAILYPRIEAVAKALPGRLWRVFGPEYASPPYLPPRLFHEYVVGYDKPIVDSIQKYGGFARLHSHGKLHDILDHIAATGASGLDPIEPPPQGDVTLKYVKERVGEQMVLFGNLEISDIENLPTDQFAEKVKTAISEGTSGKGRGFILMPSACPYGRVLSPLTMRNYEKMVEIVESI
jgi:uroporphyrinogen-III decarboxylase